MKQSIFLLLGLFGALTTVISQDSAKKTAPVKDTKSIYFIGNSLTWDTVPPTMEGDLQWHVGCGKSLPFLFKNPEEPCVKTSTLWPTALKEKQYDIVSVQPHYGSLAENATVISEWMKMQPKAVFIIHTGWAPSAKRIAEWTSGKEGEVINHGIAPIEALIDLLKKNNPGRDIRRTRAMDLLVKVAADAEARKAPIQDVAELYRDKIHMNVVTGRYMMHNAMRHALGQPRSAKGFEKLEPAMKKYLDSVLDTLGES